MKVIVGVQQTVQVGGGTVLVPVLALLFAFPQSEAQGSALLAMLFPSVARCVESWWLVLHPSTSKTKTTQDGH